MNGTPRAQSPDSQAPISSTSIGAIRRFHIAPDGTEPPVDVLPAALEPFRDASMVRFTWPLVITDDPSSPPFTPLADALASAAPVNATVLRDNLARVERMVRAHGLDRGLPEVLGEVIGPLLAGLGLHEGPAADLAQAWNDMTAAIPADAMLIRYGPDSLKTLIELVARRHHGVRRAALEQQQASLAAELEVLLPRTSADDLTREVGHGARFLDPAALAAVVGTTRRDVGPERRARIARVREELGHPIALPMVVFEATLDAAAARFDAISSALCRKIAAMHAARMELEGTYDPDRHDALLESFDWRALSAEELALLPTVVAVIPGAELASELGALSALLLSGRPLHVVAEVDPAADPADTTGWRLELANLGVALRQVWVQQSCVSRPDHLMAGLHEALRNSRGALHVVSQPPKRTTVAPWLVAGSAIEGRGQPLFRYDPSARAFADRVDFSGNPSPDLDWPMDDSGAAFTFAHYALLSDRLRAHFRALPADLVDDDLIPLESWLALELDEASKRVPVIEAIDGEGTPVSLAVSRWLAFTTRDRLGFWRALQELAGIHNAWADRAAAGASEAMRAQADEELAALALAHAAEVEAVRASATDQAMRRLTDVLLGGDLLSSGARPDQPTAPSVALQPESSDAPEVEVVEDEPAASYDDPYIDTILCTSCNECINLNPQLFLYDNNKQALIGDPDAGTFQELVLAAEVCPARCIHPGKPRNPGEPGLDALVAKVAELGV